MMLPTDRPAEFLITIFILIAVPGPSVVFIVGRGIALGRVAALATVAGNATGFVVQLVLVSVGVGTVVARSEGAMTALQIAGAAYIVYLGVRNIRHRNELAAALHEGQGEGLGSRGRAFREGLTVGATNPKGILTFTAVLPPFIGVSQDHVTADIAVLGLVCILVSLGTDGAWALASGSARRWLGGSEHSLAVMTAVGGTMLVGVGVVLMSVGHT